MLASSKKSLFFFSIFSLCRLRLPLLLVFTKRLPNCYRLSENACGTAGCQDTSIPRKKWMNKCCIRYPRTKTAFPCTGDISSFSRFPIYCQKRSEKCRSSLLRLYIPSFGLLVQSEAGKAMRTITSSSTDTSKERNILSDASGRDILGDPKSTMLNSASSTATKSKGDVGDGESSDTSKNSLKSEVCSSACDTDSGFVREDDCISQGQMRYKWVDIPFCHTQLILMKRPVWSNNRWEHTGMPNGYPSTVEEGYRPFFFYSLLGASISNFSSAVGFQCLLSGFFVSSTPELWVLKDLFPALFATYLANNVVSYENKPKRWYLISSLLYNATSITDILISSLSADYLVAGSVCSSVLRQSSALMFLVTRSCVLQHFAIQNNLGEITKKLNSYLMVIYTLASALGAVFCYFVPNFYIKISVAIACLFVNQAVLTPLSLSVVHFRLLTLNCMTILVHHYIHQEINGKSLEGDRKRTVLSPEEVSRLTGVFEALPKEVRRIPKLLYVSPPLHRLVIHSSTLHEDLLFISASRSFCIGLFHTSRMPLVWRKCWQWLQKMWKERLSPYCPVAFTSLFKGIKSFHKFLWRKKKGKLHGKQLVLLVQSDCPTEDVVFANFLLLTAALQHAESKESLSIFLQACEVEETKWRQESDSFLQLLKIQGWNVRRPVLDHPDFRLSTLLKRHKTPLPSCMTSKAF